MYCFTSQTQLNKSPSASCTLVRRLLFLQPPHAAVSAYLGLDESTQINDHLVVSQDGESCIHAAVGGGNIAICRMLIDAGLDPNVVDYVREAI